MVSAEALKSPMGQQRGTRQRERSVSNFWHCRQGGFLETLAVSEITPPVSPSCSRSAQIPRLRRAAAAKACAASLGFTTSLLRASVVERQRFRSRPALDSRRPAAYLAAMREATHRRGQPRVEAFPKPRSSRRESAQLHEKSDRLDVGVCAAIVGKEAAQ
jgi:hypothetical protein